MAASARPIPVFPDVPSIMVPPGLINPDFSASSIIFTAILSFMELPGLKVSTLASTSEGMPFTTLFNFTRGVLPMVSSMLL